MTPLQTRSLTRLPEGTALSRFITALGADPGETLAKAAAWKDTPQVYECFQLYVKAGLTPASISDSTWAGALVETGIASEALTILRGLSVVGALEDRVRRIPFNQIVPKDATTDPIGDFIPEQDFTPVSALDVGQVGPLVPYKMGTIVGLSTELLKIGGLTAERAIRTIVLTRLARRLDTLFLDPANAGPPASITNGLTPVVSTGSTPSAIAADLASLLAEVTTGGPLTWVMKTTTAARVQGALGAAAAVPQSVLGIPLIVSDTSPAQITLLDTSQILLADEGFFDVSISRDSSVRMDSAPAAETAMTHFFQWNLIGIKTLRWLNWVRGNDDSVAYMTVSY